LSTSSTKQSTLATEEDKLASNAGKKRDASGRILPLQRQGVPETLLQLSSVPVTSKISSSSTSSAGLITSYLTVRENRPCSVSRAQTITKLVAHAVYSDLLPTSFCEAKGMKSLFEFLEPNYQSPSHKTVMAHVSSSYNEGVERLITFLASATQDGTKVSITCDYWTNSQMQSFFTVTAHVIVVEGGEWTLKRCVLGTPHSQTPHTGDYVAKDLESLLTQFGLKEKVWFATHDNASNMHSGMKLCGLIPFNIGCFAHLLHLAVTGTIKDNPNIQECIDKLRSFISRLHHSTTMSTLFHNQRDSLCNGDSELEHLRKRELQNDNITRWSSSWIMLKSYFDLEVVVDICGRVNKDFMNILPDKLTAETLRSVTEALEPLAQVTTLWQTEKHSILSEVYPVLFSVTRKLKQRAETFKRLSPANKFYQALASAISERFCLDDLHFLTTMSIHVLASALDPRKFKRLSFLCEKSQEIVHARVITLGNEVSHSFVIFAILHLITSSQPFFSALSLFLF
jgi:hypothetical protein